MQEIYIYILPLEGQVSRNHVDWFEELMKRNFESVMNVSNISQYVQLCGQYMNNQFKRGIKYLKDQF